MCVWNKYRRFKFPLHCARYWLYNIFLLRTSPKGAAASRFHLALCSYVGKALNVRYAVGSSVSVQTCLCYQETRARGLEGILIYEAN